jgi:hypothetical protein
MKKRQWTDTMPGHARLTDAAARRWPNLERRNPARDLRKTMEREPTRLCGP